ncbi:MAG TPA: hypothetical protein VN578_23340 [Candidatus Binatia bacterium]|jgi:hypothetical protein|nr:hypothetical protein [Candidatus Binatia bacterium]
MFNTSTLFASLLWGSVGVGYWIYGKKQQSLGAMVGGVLMVVVSYFTGSALVMSLLSLGIVAGVYLMIKRGI